VKDEIIAVMKTDGRFKLSDQIMKVALLAEPFSAENGMLTHTMKIKRNVVATKYADMIDKMFSSK
jgi:long-chain acyl-CoA synthetase